MNEAPELKPSLLTGFTSLVLFLVLFGATWRLTIHHYLSAVACVGLASTLTSLRARSFQEALFAAIPGSIAALSFWVPLMLFGVLSRGSSGDAGLGVLLAFAVMIMKLGPVLLLSPFLLLAAFGGSGIGYLGTRIATRGLSLPRTTRSWILVVGFVYLMAILVHDALFLRKLSILAGAFKLGPGH